MVASAMGFVAQASLPLSPVMGVPSIVSNTPGNLSMAIAWIPNNGAMDTTDDPSPPQYTFFVDDVERAITTMTWPGGDAMQVNASGAAAVTSMRLTLDSVDSNVLNTDGTVAKAPQTKIVFV